MNRKISPHAIIALKEALAVIYWKKNDLKSFVAGCIDNKDIVSSIDWANQRKYDSVCELIDIMTIRPERYQEDLLSLIKFTASIDNFSHLEWLDDAEIRIKNAKEKVQALRELSTGYFDLLKETEAIQENRKKYMGNIQASIGFKQKIIDMKSEFVEITRICSPQERGFAFEEFLSKLFELFELHPKRSFRITGEQIDGAFSYDGTDYLLEAKWQKELVDLGDIYKFNGKIESKLKNTLGLFLSINGFSNSIYAQNGKIKNMILFDGSDLVQVLENRIELPEMILTKRRHASQTGELMYRINC